MLGSLIKPEVIRIFVLCALGVFLAFTWAPFLILYLNKKKMWRKQARTTSIDGKPAPIFHKLHKEKETNTPRFGGLLIWPTTLFIILFFYAISFIPGIPHWLSRMNFLSRAQTWLPLAALVAASLLGLFDDLWQVYDKGKYVAGGIRFTRRLAIVFLIALIGALWFYFKLNRHTLHIPGNGDIEMGIWYLPLFIMTVLACWAGGIIDGIDGLSGGVFSVMFGAFAVIAFATGQYDLAVFCGVIAGTTLAFLWFNIQPAKFYMGETGTIGLTTTLAIVAFLTDSVLVLPIIAGLLVLEAGSVILQLSSKKLFHKKIFLCAPFHHHLEAKGWPREKITMRFWLLSMVLAIIGIAIRLLG